MTTCLCKNRDNQFIFICIKDTDILRNQVDSIESYAHWESQRVKRSMKITCRVSKVYTLNDTILIIQTHRIFL